MMAERHSKSQREWHMIALFGRNSRPTRRNCYREISREWRIRKLQVAIDVSHSATCVVQKVALLFLQHFVTLPGCKNGVYLRRDFWQLALHAQSLLLCNLRGKLPWSTCIVYSIYRHKSKLNVCHMGWKMWKDDINSRMQNKFNLTINAIT